MRRLSSASTPREVYHGVPLGWSRDELVHRYAVLGGTRGFEPPEATEPRAPSWLPDRYNWLQYRAALYCIANGIRAGDPVCVELAIEYIELNYFGSYSGFLRERFARALKQAELSQRQAGRLKRHFLALRA